MFPDISCGPLSTFIMVVVIIGMGEELLTSLKNYTQYQEHSRHLSQVLKAKSLYANN